VIRGRWSRILAISGSCALLLAACGGPRIWQIQAGHPQIRVTLREGCPATVVGYHDVKNPGGGSSDRLVPANPRQGLICRYGPRLLGPEGESGPGLYRSTMLNESDATRLANVIDNISTAGPPPGPPAACPADAGSATIIVFSYSSEPAVDLWYSDEGCQTLDNSTIGAYEEGNPSFYNSFISTIDALSPP
jgi:hypothetical protein